ncbi:MAG: NAD(P)-dependent oxidoreductase [Aeromicrobium sp.]|nr:NAD(P)-dependent oxidoreductase [Aeromicrobium sp.]
MTRIAVVGLGTMGGRIAGRLLSQGHDVWGTNRTKTRADALIEQGMHWCDTPREAAESADVVISMVTDAAALHAITSGPDGILAGLRPGTVHIDMSTVGPETSRDVADEVAAVGASMLAAPVSGSVSAVEEGSLAIIVGGDADVFARVEPILRQLGTQITVVGDPEQALLIKMAINISLAVQMLAFSEGVLLAERGGVDRDVAIDALTSSAIGSPMLKARAAMVRELPDQAWFDVRLMHKDIRLTLESGGQLGVPLPTTRVADDLLTAATALGYEHRDIAVMFRVLSEL